MRVNQYRSFFTFWINFVLFCHFLNIEKRKYVHKFVILAKIGLNWCEYRLCQNTEDKTRFSVSEYGETVPWSWWKPEDTVPVISWERCRIRSKSAHRAGSDQNLHIVPNPITPPNLPSSNKRARVFHTAGNHLRMHNTIGMDGFSLCACVFHWLYINISQGQFHAS